MLGIYTEAFGACRHFARWAEEAGLDAESVFHLLGCASGVPGRKHA